MGAGDARDRRGGDVDGAARPRRRRPDRRQGGARDPEPAAGAEGGERPHRLLAAHRGLLRLRLPSDRKSVVEGKSVSVRVDLGGRRIIKKKKQETKRQTIICIS